MISILSALAVRNNFTVVNDKSYFPNASSLRRIIKHLPERSVYVNHCNMWMEAPADVGFFNMIREPIDHDESAFYYEFDPKARTTKDAREALEKAKHDSKCGCFKMEYDECIRARAKANCSLTFATAKRRQFCNAPEDWGPHNDNFQYGCDPVHVLQSKYVFVGLTEQYARSIATLERLLPDWFAGASEILAQVSWSKVTNDTNSLTGTHLTGCISKEARRILMQDTINQDELDFYDVTEALFWRKFDATAASQKLRMTRFDHDFVTHGRPGGGERARACA